MAYSSISQGIFFNKPKKTESKKSSEEFLTIKYFEGYAPPVDTAGIRCEFYVKHVSRIKLRSLELKKSWYKDLTDRVYDYVASSEHPISNFQGAITPMAFVITGMLQDENKELMDNIFTKIKQYSPHTASISSQSFTNVKAAFQLLCHQIMGNRMEQLEAGDDTFSSSELDDVMDSSSPQQISSRNSKRKVKSVSANDLQSWFRLSTQSRPIVICIEDIDLFPVNAVQNLIMAFSCIKLPVVFIAGITSYCETFDVYVPQKCPTTFVYQTFTAMPPEERLTRFIKYILHERCSPFQLSGPVLSYMCNIFSLQEFSISRLEQILNLCLLEHYRLAESVLCADFSDILTKVLTPSTLTPEVINLTFGSAEVSGTLKGGPRITISTPTGKYDDYTVTRFQSSPRKVIRQAGVQMKEVEDNVLGFIRKQLEWFSFMEFLYVIVQGLPGLPTAFTSIRNLYSSCWDGNIFEINPNEDSVNSALDLVLGIFNTMSRSVLEARLKKGLQVLNDYEDDFQEHECVLSKTDIPYLSQKIEEFITKLAAVEQDEEKLSKCSEDQQLTIKPKTRTEWKEMLKAKIDKSGKLFPKLRDNIVSSLRKDAKRFLRRLGDHPYSKAFIFDDVEFLEEMITPNTAKRIHAALLEPEKFLNCSSCTDLEDMDHTRSDVSVVYNLILEQQMRNVNLNIIFESFKSQVEDYPASSPKKRRSVVSKQKKNENLLIRFRHVIAELQQMGFVKQSKSKVHIDEISRLNFGF